LGRQHNNWQVSFYYFSTKCLSDKWFLTRRGGKTNKLNTGTKYYDVSFNAL
jgi:hypothetical protein